MARRVLLGFALTGMAVLYAPTAMWLFDRWTLSVWHHAHGLLIPPVVAYFAAVQLRRHRDLPAGASPWGFAIVVPALLLQALDAGMHTELLSAISLVMLLPGLSLLLLGAARTRVILTPLLFLVFALPIPLVLTEQIHGQLRAITTAATATVIPWFGIPIFAEGTTLHLAAGILEVSDACSGFSTLYASVAVACLTAFTIESRWRQALVVLAAAPLAIAANILRVVGLVLMVVWKGSGILDTFVHPLSGMLTFALALPILLWLGREKPAYAPATAAEVSL